MPQTCPKCHRANPADALFCYEDGFSLGGRAGQGGPVDPGQQPFPHPFVFPNGAACRNFDQLALACHNEWATAMELVRNGDLSNFLSGLGRADLAKAARDASRQDDMDRALDQLLGQLPANTIEPAKLHVETLLVNLGQLTVGKDHRWELPWPTRGCVCCRGPSLPIVIGWPSAKAAARPARCFSIKAARSSRFRFAANCSAPPPSRSRDCWPSRPTAARPPWSSPPRSPSSRFPKASWRGRSRRETSPKRPRRRPRSPRRCSRTAPSPAGTFRTAGPIPSKARRRRGSGAVQQFFEALGLTTPPKVEVRESSLLLEGEPGTGLSRTLDVAAVEKRPIFASAVSDQSWLKVSKVVLDGRTAHVKLAVDSVPDRPGETLSANLTVRANGNQRFVVPVSLRVFGKPHTSARPSAAVYPGVRVVEVLPDAATYPAAIPLPARPWQPPDGARANGGSREPAVMEALPVVDEDDVPRRASPPSST